jgi:ketosteroid isomerase-like protein
VICNVLTRSLNDKTRHYSYVMDIKEILVFGDAAVVRLVWTLTIEQPDGSTAKSIEPGMDIFQKQPDGSWKIIRYMSFER